MYTSYIGKKFLAYYNRRKNTSYTAERFFLDKFFKCFFLDEGHLMHVANSPFHYIPEKDVTASYGSKSLAQLNTLKNRIAENRVYMGIYVGGPAEDMDATTSGQITGIPNVVEKDDVYASWIGAAFGIGVNGGYVMLIDNEELLWALYKGWKHYRKYLQQTDGLKDKQIETWNGNWVRYRLENPDSDDRLPIEPEKAMGKWAIPTQSWGYITFMLARRFHMHKSIVVYAYNLSQTNTTLGFINIIPAEVNSFFEWREKIFPEEPTILNDNQINLLVAYYDFKIACKWGVIGLKALEPKALREYIPRPFGGGKEFIYSETTLFYFKIFKTWIIAMLNKIELLDLADEMAIALLEFSRSDKKGRAVKNQLSKDIRESRGLTQFTDNLTMMLDEVPALSDTLKEIIKEVLAMPIDHFPLFLSLVRFQYSYRASKN